MVTQISAWFIGLASAGVMLSYGIQAGMLTRPRLPRRCGACGRLVRPGAVCPCSQENDG
jgi:hypothetical protein